MFFALLTMLLISIALKIHVARRLFKCEAGPVKSLAFLFVFTALSQSALELYILYISQNLGAHNYELALRAYYTLITTQAILIPITVWSVVYRQVPRPGLVGTFLLAGLFGVLMATTDTIVAGAAAIANSITRVPGEYYFAFPVIAMIAITFAVAIPLYTIYKQQDEIMHIKSSMLLVGVSILFLVSGAILMAMAMGAAFNAMAVIPLVVAIFLFSVGECLQPYSVYDVRVHIPWTKKGRLIRDLTRRFRYIEKEEDLNSKALARQYHDELLLLSEKLFTKQADAAKWLNISEAKLSRDLSAIKKAPK
ncbi:MAG: hypothetical protein AAF385_17310 [Pseudomonadota bacterium]